MASTSSGTLEGTLSKWTNVMKGWQYRFFVLDENAGLLSYYTSKEKMMKGVRRGCVRLKDALIGIDDQEDNTFTITVDHKTFHFQARHADEREQWVRRLEDTIRRHANRSRLWDSQSAFYIAGGYTKESSGKRANHLELVGRRVAEADAYLQLMIEQTNSLNKRIAELNDATEQAKCKALQDNASAMLDHIKHSIVSLQIAKNMAHPVNGIYNGPTVAKNTAGIMMASSGSGGGGGGDGGGGGSSSSGGSGGSGIGDKPNEAHLSLKNELAGDDEDDSATENATTAPLGLVVPETSYSSSEGEEDFYDAYDDPFTSLGNSPIGCTTRGFVETSPTHDKPQDSYGGGVDVAGTTAPKPSSSATAIKTKTVAEVDETGSSKVPSSRSSSYDNGIDYDALYEEEEEMDLSMEAHGSMITHLLSQVKIGMDLTKVVLPTFILERRSLLEMYADYFAHPDLFLKISELDDPRDRIVQVCRWYLSAYHAGRKSAVAKKPYNPILGEVFQCHWDIPGETQNEPEVKDGPVPWCRRDQLTFLAEQVSHHPPISAFYAEHYNKKITFTAHVWTKSKFLGLSIGVHNIGEGVVTLVDRSEEYIVTFPNGYGRSILTVPWIELGGSVEIKCPQTGYYANVEFLTKPFYGGKRNKVTAEIYSPNDKKPFVSIAGEWSGLMEAKWHDKNKTEVFVDVNRIPIFKKQVRPIVEQDEYESRRVWKEVTAGLKFNDIERATNAKFVVEQQQRDQAKVRKEYDLAWEHKHFKPVGDNWIYTKPLSQRMYLQEKEAKR
ncbi:oxysterol-binding protein-related protein 9 isoform X2 [Drosophila navojoa]|uniref:oxysterol-binding protein-related protein 9 isoform X2 n=1 Tax=Drosophila navojoa TaxID=7232 RepID=UPI000846497A|nr:oxysterol-binding protein-related protein 9 isoform X2 [Drosophila navojoa]